MMTPVESFIHRENIKNFEKRLADRTTDQDQRKMLAEAVSGRKSAKLKAKTTKRRKKTRLNRYMRLDALQTTSSA